jgi:ATP-dependent DNA ligase
VPCLAHQKKPERFLDAPAANELEGPFAIRVRLQNQIADGVRRGVDDRTQQREAVTLTVDRVVPRVGLEGVIAKRRTSRYTPGDRTAWVKLKLDRQQEFVVGGLPSGTARRRCTAGRLLRGS